MFFASTFVLDNEAWSLWLTTSLAYLHDLVKPNIPRRITSIELWWFSSNFKTF